MFEHSEWFKPYVAGFYAWRYLDEDVSREEAVARLNELLGLERVVINGPNRPGLAIGSNQSLQRHTLP
jgi:hypothetical protein